MIDPRKELREKVQTRQQLLADALKSSEAAGNQAERATSITNQLNAAADATGGGWETMTEVSADRLAKWLEATKVLLPQLEPIGSTLVTPPPPVDAQAEEVSISNRQH